MESGDHEHQAAAMARTLKEVSNDGRVEDDDEVPHPVQDLHVGAGAPMSVKPIDQAIQKFLPLSRSLPAPPAWLA